MTTEEEPGERYFIAVFIAFMVLFITALVGSCLNGGTNCL